MLSEEFRESPSTVGSMARTGLTPEVHTEIVKAVAAGVPVQYACQAAGVSYETARRWLAIGRGHAGRQPSLRPETRRQYKEFAADVDAAEAQAVRRNLLLVEAAGRTDWRASSWWLERVHPDRFARQTHVTVQSVEDLEAELREILGPEVGTAVIEEARRNAHRLLEQQQTRGEGSVVEVPRVGELPAEAS